MSSLKERWEVVGSIPTPSINFKEVIMSWLGFLSFFIFQWFGIRLARIVDTEINEIIGFIWIRRWPLTNWDFNGK